MKQNFVDRSEFQLYLSKSEFKKRVEAIRFKLHVKPRSKKFLPHLYIPFVKGEV